MLKKLITLKFIVFQFFLITAISHNTYAGISESKLLILPRLMKCEKLTNVEVYSIEPNKIEQVCEGIERSYNFFYELGYTIKNTLRIYILEQLPKKYLENGLTFEHGKASSTYGIYDSETEDIILMSFEKYLSVPHSFLEVPGGEELYISFIAHETAHAIADMNYKFSPEKSIRRELNEFIAYSVQFATMEQDLKDKILYAFEKKKWEPFRNIYDAHIDYFFINHIGFAVKSYIFFETKEGRKAFHDIINGSLKPLRY
jgi:hypothetical protein